MSPKHNSQIDRSQYHNIHPPPSQKPTNIHPSTETPPNPSLHSLQTTKQLNLQHPAIFKHRIPITDPPPRTTTNHPTTFPLPSRQTRFPRAQPQVGYTGIEFWAATVRQSLESQRTTPLATWRAASFHGIGETSVANKCRVQKKERSAEIMEWNGMND